MLSPDPFQLPRKPRAVVFDLDGTLIDSEALVLEAYIAATGRFGLPFTHEQFLTLVGQHRAATEQKLAEYFGAGFPLPKFFDAVTAHIGDGVAPLKAGALDLIDELERRETPFALATSSGPGWVGKHFEAHDLGRRFHAVVTRDDVKNGKPHPEPYLMAATLLGFDPADILAIEDSPTGVRSALAAGMMTVMTPDLIQPDDDIRGRVLHVAASLGDVLNIIRA
ncbi:MAG: HAD-IA family hydrolase [Alphaproteobacteria bacterium]|nr:HAD-IA family hydrolase [Alphaproteobacteria bacterium]